MPRPFRSPRLDVSPWTAAALPPIAVTALSSSDWRRPVINTREPSAAKRLAMPRPMPALPPVTNATLPVSLPVIVNPPSDCVAPSGGIYRRAFGMFAFRLTRRHVRQQRTESFRHRQIGDHRIAEPLVRQPGKHRGRHRGDHLAAFGTR